MLIVMMIMIIVIMLIVMMIMIIVIRDIFIKCKCLYTNKIIYLVLKLSIITMLQEKECVIEVFRPLDLLNQCKGEPISINLKNSGVPITGKLLAFDLSINLVVISNNIPIFIKGDNVLSVAPIIS